MSIVVDFLGVKAKQALMQSAEMERVVAHCMTKPVYKIAFACEPHSLDLARDLMQHLVHRIRNASTSAPTPDATSAAPSIIPVIIALSIIPIMPRSGGLDILLKQKTPTLAFVDLDFSTQIADYARRTRHAERHPISLLLVELRYDDEKPTLCLKEYSDFKGPPCLTISAL